MISLWIGFYLFYDTGFHWWTTPTVVTMCVGIIVETYVIAKFFIGGK